MTLYPPYTTTVIGSYSVPRWFEFLATLVEEGRLSPPELADAQYRLTQAAIADQRSAGIDLITGGEMHRRRSNRHAPLNAMLNFFWARMTGFAKDRATVDGLAIRPMPLAHDDPRRTHPSAVCIGAVADDTDLGLTEEFAMVSRHVDCPAKITVTGPHALSKLAWNEHYPDLRAMMADIARLLNRNLVRLTESGCTDIQIDEPVLAGAPSAEAEHAVEAINSVFEGLPPSVRRSFHACQGNYAVGVSYDGQLGFRCFAGEDYQVDAIAAVDCDVLLVEGDLAYRFEGKLGNRQLGVGIVDVQDVTIETASELTRRLAPLNWLTPEQTLLTCSCGLCHLPRHIAVEKLKSLAQAQRFLRS
jgi:5-methyltetrahydropteroyltriglutamate--homocysteine methyltransferase